MRSVFELASCAEEHVRSYTDREGHYAFRSYDHLGDPNRLEPVDLFAPALLDAPVQGEHVRRMYLPDGPYRQLRDALQTVLDGVDGETRFEDQDLHAGDGPWALVHAALVASDHTRGIKASKVTKILHRKRPRLVPIFDSRVAAFYGCTPRRPAAFWPILQADLVANGAWLTDLGSSHRTPDDRPVATTRLLDMVVWDHVTTSH